MSAKFCFVLFCFSLSNFPLCVDHTVVSDSEAPGTVAHHAPLFMGFSQQEHWSQLLFPSPGDLPNTGIKPVSPAVTGDFFPTSPGKPILIV